MSAIMKRFALAVFALFGLLFGAVPVVRAGVVEAPRSAKTCRTLPVIKNLTGLRTQVVCEDIAAPKELTAREVKKLAARANSSADHLAVARFYQAEANSLDARAIAYDSAAADLRNTPVAKNLAFPGAAARFEFEARGLREKAVEDRAIATTHEKMTLAALN